MGELGFIILLRESMLERQAPKKLATMLHINLIFNIEDIGSCSLPSLSCFFGQSKGLHSRIVKRFTFVLIIVSVLLN